MGRHTLSVLVIVLAIACVGNCSDKVQRLGDLLGSLGAGAFSRPSDVDYCTIEKPADTCLEDAGPTVCFAEACTFVPEYGEEITSVWQIYLDGYSNLFGNGNKKKKYRKILDFGATLTKGFEGEICKNQNSVCDCNPHDPNCTCSYDNVKVCKQKYTDKFSLYYVYNTYFCEKSLDPWALIFGKLFPGGSSSRHFTYAPSEPKYPQIQQPRYPSQYNPHKQTVSQATLFKYMQLLKKDKHHHLGDLVVCEEKEEYNPFGHFGYGPKKPDYKKPAYMQDYNTLVKHALLKVKVPTGCECEEL